MFDVNLPGFINHALRWIEFRGWGAIVGELFQNAMDENTTEISMTMKAVPERPFVEIRVEDNSPEGFQELKDSYTLFAHSKKVVDPKKAGRFNLGEKYVIALAHESSIVTTTGSVSFDRKAGRSLGRRKTQAGSVFTGIFKIPREEMEQVEKFARSILVPTRIRATFNGEVLPSRTPIHTFEEALPTEVATGVGEVLKTARMKTTVEVFETLPGEEAHLYELGLPVVATGDKWHVSIGQRVPLNTERDNVPPSYIKTVRTFVVNQMAAMIEPDDAGATWVNEALADSRIEALAARRILNVKFGEKRVSRDPGDPESAARAFAEGHRVIESRDLTSEQRANAKKHGLIDSSSKLFPTPKLESSPDGVEPIPEESWTAPMSCISSYAKALAWKLRRVDLSVSFYSTLGRVLAAYGREEKHLSLTKRVERLSSCELDALLIHEFAHDLVSNHLTEEYFDECCRLGAEMRQLAILDPKIFLEFEGALAACTGAESHSRLPLEEPVHS